MAAPGNAGSSDLPSFSDREARGEHVKTSDTALRLFWGLQGDITTGILVMGDDYEPLPRSNLEAYHRPQQTPNWHPISQGLLTTPPVSSIVVNLDTLEIWEDEWSDAHREHCDWGEASADERQTVPLTTEEIAERQEDDDYDDDKPPRKLIRCCNQPRPGRFEPLTVHASTRRGVTIHDYLTAVHPWLMSKRNDLVAALGVWTDDFPADSSLMVTYIAPDALTVGEEEHWAPCHPDGSPQKALGIRNVANVEEPRLLRDDELLSSFTSGFDGRP